MVTAELLNYIRGQISQGQNLETIKASLLSQKWNEADINEAFSQVETSQSVQTPQGNIQTTVSTTTEVTNEKLNTKSLIVILLCLLLNFKLVAL